MPNVSGSVHPVPYLAAQVANKSLDLLNAIGIQWRFDIAPSSAIRKTEDRSAMRTKSKFVRAFVASQTISDGRKIDDARIDQIAETFNTATYAPRIVTALPRGPPGPAAPRNLPPSRNTLFPPPRPRTFCVAKGAIPYRPKAGPYPWPRGV